MSFGYASSKFRFVDGNWVFIELVFWQIRTFLKIVFWQIWTNVNRQKSEDFYQKVFIWKIFMPVSFQSMKPSSHKNAQHYKKLIIQWKFYIIFHTIKSAKRTCLNCIIKWKLSAKREREGERKREEKNQICNDKIKLYMMHLVKFNVNRKYLLRIA